MVGIQAMDLPAHGHVIKNAFAGGVNKVAANLVGASQRCDEPAGLVPSLNAWRDNNSHFT